MGGNSDRCDGLVAMAVADNAAWCDAVCRSLELATSWPPGLWAVAEPPPLFPHLITLDARATTAEVVALLDSRSDSWVKDSFANVGLGEHGFSVVAQASWLYHPPGSMDTGAEFSVVGSDEELAGWMAASSTIGIITPRLLADPTVRLVTVRRGGRPVGGAALSISDHTLGFSNVFTAEESLPATWKALISAAGQLAPGRALVGYETGEELDAAVHAGFVPTGYLRIWRRPAR